MWNLCAQYRLPSAALNRSLYTFDYFLSEADLCSIDTYAIAFYSFSLIKDVIAYVKYLF